MSDLVRRTPPDQEQEAARRLVLSIAPRIDGLGRRWDGDDHHALEGSALAGNDRHAAPFQVSHAAWLSIGHAIDNLAALRALTISAGEQPTVMTRTFAAYPLVRASIENASAALWLIGPKNRNERLARRFRQAITDAGNRDKTIALTAPTPTSQTDRVRPQIEALANARGINPADLRPAHFREMVRGGHASLGMNEDTGEAIWRSLSALTHGDAWASLMIADREDVIEHPDEDTLTIRMTSSLTNVANTISIALSTTEAALSLFDTRRRPPQ